MVSLSLIEGRNPAEVVMAARRGRLIKRRTELGYSQETLAVRIGSDRTTVGRLERGETDPYPHTRSKLCAALHVTPAELDRLLATDPESARTAAGTAHAISGDVMTAPQPTGALDMYRRELLRLFSVAGALVALPPATDGAIDHLVELQRSGDLSQYSALNRHLWEIFGLSTTKQLVYPLVQDQLGVLLERMRGVTSLNEHRRLCVLASELFQLAGEICFDGNRYADAAHCYSLAASAGREAGAHDQWACALTRHAFVRMFDHQYQDAASILDAAARIAARGDNRLPTRHWVAAVQAAAYANLGELGRCESALDTADRVVGISGASIPGGWLRFDDSRLTEERGTCYLTLGRSDNAAELLAQALQQTSSLRRHGGLLTELAVIGTRRRDVDEILVRGHAALDVVEQTRSSGYVGRKLRTLQGRLGPMIGNSRIADLNDRVMQVTATP